MVFSVSLSCVTLTGMNDPTAQPRSPIAPTRGPGGERKRLVCQGRSATASARSASSAVALTSHPQRVVHAPNASDHRRLDVEATTTTQPA